MKIRALLFSDKEASEKSQTPDWFMSELLEGNRDYEIGRDSFVGRM